MHGLIPSPPSLNLWEECQLLLQRALRNRHLITLQSAWAVVQGFSAYVEYARAKIEGTMLFMWLVRALLTILLWPFALVAMKLYAHFGNYDRAVIHPFMFLGPAKFLSDCELAVQLLKPYPRDEGRARSFNRKLRIWLSGNEIHKFQYFGMYSVSHAVCAHGEYGIASYLYYYLRLEFHIAVPWRICYRRRAAMDADLAARAETLVWLEIHNFPQELKNVFSIEQPTRERCVSRNKR